MMQVYISVVFPRIFDVTKMMKQVAKMLAFASSAGSVAWNKFSQIWLLSVGLSPTEAGLVKSIGEAPYS
jgi:hypothetical protein